MPDDIFACPYEDLPERALFARCVSHDANIAMPKTRSMYINRELSWLEFNQRVLDEANNASIPPLERLKFLAITASNLDEFFMVRVGGLQLLASQAPGKQDPTGATPEEQLEAIGDRAHRMLEDQYACFTDQLEPALESHQIQRIRPQDLNAAQAAAVGELFTNEIYPVATPMVLTLDEPFPLLVNRSLVICVQLAESATTQSPKFAIIPLGQVADRIIPLPSDSGHCYILLEDVVRMHVEQFFPGVEIADCAFFRITRNADLSVQEDSASDLLAGMEEVLNARKRSGCVRLEISAEAGSPIRRFLRSALEVRERDVYIVPGPLDLAVFMNLTGIPGFDQLRYPDWPPQPTPQVDPKISIFDTIAARDVVLFQPYESYDPVVRLVEEAADDPQVLAIKQILYRTSRNSPIVAALKRAARNGKHVTAIVELKARFDEARNIGWAKSLEQASVQVIYGVKGLKTHAKVCIVVRREPQGITRYVHYGTGNYNEITSKLYSDISLMTCDEALTSEGSMFFNAITGYSQPREYHKIEAAPIGLRDKILELIENETRNSRQGQPGRIMAQLNSLVDSKVINALYRASRAGVRVDLNIRGICCLRPAVPGISDNIRVVSILDRFLEHCRILYFFNGGRELTYISSADWMPRNLIRRVELFVPVEDPAGKQRLIECLESYASDTVKGQVLGSDGFYSRAVRRHDQPPHRHQQHMYDLARKSALATL
jgi:polyphosphate kinase